MLSHESEPTIQPTLHCTICVSTPNAVRYSLAPLVFHRCRPACTDRASSEFSRDAGCPVFIKRGYFATKVDDIAAEARVAPAAVYAVAGCKQSLLHTLMDTWTADPIVAATLNRIAETEDPVGIIRITAAASREMGERFADVMRVMSQPHLLIEV